MSKRAKRRLQEQLKEEMDIEIDMEDDGDSAWERSEETAGDVSGETGGESGGESEEAVGEQEDSVTETAESPEETTESSTAEAEETAEGSDEASEETAGEAEDVLTETTKSPEKENAGEEDSKPGDARSEDSKAEDVRPEALKQPEKKVENPAERAARQKKEQEDAIKRQERKRRRRRAQIKAYIELFVFILIIAAVIFFGIRFIKGAVKDRRPSVDSSVEELDNIISGEPEIEIQEPEVIETVPELTPEQKLDEIIDAAIEVMPIEDKVAGLFIVTPEAITGVGTAVMAGDGTKEALSKYAVGGLIYFTKNIKSGEQITEMISNSVLFSRYPVFIAVEEEGGSISRVAGAKLGENVGSPQKIGGSMDPEQAYAAGSSIANYLTPLGFNLDLAPVADLNNVEGSYIGDRSYGSDGAMVGSMVSAMVRGLEENGVSACLKHFPGAGSSKEDPKGGMADTERSADEFRAEEFAAFRAGIEAGADFVMVSHLSIPSLVGDKTPCSLSAAIVTDILRGEMGFNGVIITDAMNMGAITEYYESDAAAIMALKAGCDMILMPEDFEKAYTGVLEAVQNGTVSEERINDSLRRIYRIKYADKLVD